VKTWLYLKALAARLFDRGFGGPPIAPDDPYVGVREPRKRGPGGTSAAVALAEPFEQPVVRADGHTERRARFSSHDSSVTFVAADFRGSDPSRG
jgi:hypothetical protein